MSSGRVVLAVTEVQARELKRLRGYGLPSLRALVGMMQWRTFSSLKRARLICGSWRNPRLTTAGAAVADALAFMGADAEKPAGRPAGERPA